MAVKPVRTLHIDLETYSPVELTKAGVYRYVDTPDFQVMLFAYAFDGQPVEVVDLMAGEEIPLDVVAALHDSTIRKLAFNANFEITCLSKHFGVEMDPAQWRCVSVHALMLGLPNALGQVAAAIGTAQQKGDGWALIRKFCMPQVPTKKNGMKTRILPDDDPAAWARFKGYCVQDVATERDVHKKLPTAGWMDVEHEHWVLDQKILRHGMMIDQSFVAAALDVAARHRERLMSEIDTLTGLDNPNSVAQLKEWLDEVADIEVESLNKKAVKEILGENQDAVVDRVLRIRQELGKSSLSKYTAMRTSVCADGRLRGLTQYYGANRTGRWAGRIVQVQNLPQNHLLDLLLARELVESRDIAAIEMLYGNVSDVLSQLIRTAFVAAPGRTYGVVDFNAIEARVIAWAAGEKWREELFARNGKIYEASAERMFNLPAGSVTKASPYRQKGKIAELALGYGGGVNALITMGGLEMGLEEHELDPIKVAWRAANKAIVQFWYDTENAVRRSLQCPGESIAFGARKNLFARRSGPWLMIQLPSGRRLVYFQARVETDDDGRDGIVYMGVDQQTKKWVQQRTWGGKLVENVVQAISRDCLMVALRRLDARLYRVGMHVHDEVIAELLDDTAAEDLELMEQLMSAPIEWAPGLPLKADGFITKYYRKEA